MAHLDAKWGVAKAKKLKVGVIRYADDFVIMKFPRAEPLKDEIKPVENFLAIRGLRLVSEDQDRAC